jgi:two-component system OmpR family sensor kinase
MIPIVYRDKIEEVLYLESSDELATSAQSLLQLLGLQWKLFSIQLEREEQLERHQVLLDRTRQTRHQEALQTLALEARRNALATFLGVASHDLKAPLGAISLWASQLSDGPEKDNIEAACARATGLIHDYLDGMALELGNSIRLDKKKVDLAALVEQEIDHQLDALAPTVRGRTKLVWDLDSVDVEADAQRFRQVVANLIGNALKHCPQGTRISISTTSVEGEALLRVDDEGPGLEQSLQPDLFEAFKNTSSNNGSGLGLWIVRKIVEAHNGTVGYNALQPGSSFWVRLPAKARS